MNPEDFLNNLEQARANKDTGKIAYQMLQGALEEGATLIHAMCAVASYYQGMFLAIGSDKDDEDEETPAS